MPDHPLVLASTSPFRKTLLETLQLPFAQLAPDCDETPEPGEPASQLVQRLAEGKARSVHRQGEPSVTVIGSDQVAELGGRIFGKPHTHEAAVEQLTALSSNTVVFHTGLCVIKEQRKLDCVVPTEVRFRKLSENMIERYLLADKPYNCAASFKSESLGCSIAESMRSDDPSALIGLPLITLCGFLNQLGVDVPAS